MRNFLKKLRSKKGLTGADIAAAITVIVLTVGIVTAIYVNTINKSKDNIRYANATRIATSIVENIQSSPYEYVVACGAADKATDITGGNKLFKTKVLNGYWATVTLGSAPTPDVARDITVKVKYKASTTYKTVTISTVKERELMDMTNSPDLSLIPNYNPSNSTNYYFPIKKTGTDKYEVTTSSDIAWYDYEEGKYALVVKTDGVDLTAGSEVGERI